MDVSKLILDFIAAIAWPIVVVFIALVFKDELRKLIHRLSHIKGKDWELSFNKELKEAEETASEVIQTSPEKLSQIPDPKANTSLYDRLIDLSTISPAAAVMVSWRDLELSVRNAAKSLQIDTSTVRTGSKIIQMLRDLDKTDRSIYNLYNRLRIMRNGIAHDDNADIDSKGASKYVDLALRLASYFNDLPN
jgi:hypothetical protein